MLNNIVIYVKQQTVTIGTMLVTWKSKLGTWERKLVTWDGKLMMWEVNGGDVSNLVMWRREEAGPEPDKQTTGGGARRTE